MALDQALARPPRCTLVNIATGESIACLFNPTELVEKVTVNWNRQAVLGLSHQPLQYQSTGNRQLPSVEFYMDKIYAREAGDDVDIDAFRGFLRALTVPASGAADGASTAPPRALLLWPGVLVVEVVVTDLEFQFRRFAVDGSVLLYAAVCSFEEILDVRVTSESRRAS